jgi:hypothetical protein
LTIDLKRSKNEAINELNKKIFVKIRN